MTTPCENCPCPHNCRALAAYCLWAAESPRDPVKIRHVVDVSKLHAERDRTAPARPEYPPAIVQLGTALAAAVRVVKASVRSEPVGVDAEEQARRLSICEACPEYDAERKRCKKCGCFAALKLRLATEHCPLEPPKW
jgi:hypothetical protein